MPEARKEKGSGYIACRSGAGGEKSGTDASQQQGEAFRCCAKSSPVTPEVGRVLMYAPSIHVPEIPRAMAVRALLVAGAGFVLLRFVLLANVPGLPGVDGGAYLMSAYEAMGAPSLGIDNAVRPILSPGWLLAPFVALLGPDRGFSVFQAVFALLPAGATYVLAHEVSRSRTIALTAALFVSLDLAMAEMLVTGVEPLVGWSAIMLALTGLIRLRAGADRRGSLLVGIGIVLSAYTSMTASGIGGIVLAAVAIGIALMDRDAGYIRRVAIPAGLGIILALPTLPAYIGTRPGLLDYGGPLVFYGPRAIDYIVLIWAVGIAVAAWRTAPARHPVRVVAIVGAGMAVLTLWRSTDEVLLNIFFRPAYYLPVCTWTATAWLLITRLTRLRWYAVGAVTAWLLVMYPLVFNGQVVLSSFATPEFVQIVRLHRALADQVQDNRSVLTNSWAHAQWIGGLTRNQTYPYYVHNVRPPQHRAADDELARCALGWRPDCDPGAAIERLDLGWLLIDVANPQPWHQPIYGAPERDPETLWRSVAELPYMTVVATSGSSALLMVTQ